MLTMAGLWRLNRRQVICRVLRAWVVWTSGTTPGSRGWISGASGSTAVGAWPAPSGIADPRVKHGVHDVDDQVEDDHRCHRDHHPCQDLRVVAVVHGRDEELSHSRPRENLLGDDE